MLESRHAVSHVPVYVGSGVMGAQVLLLSQQVLKHKDNSSALLVIDRIINTLNLNILIEYKFETEI